MENKYYANILRVLFLQSGDFVDRTHETFVLVCARNLRKRLANAHIQK